MDYQHILVQRSERRAPGEDRAAAIAAYLNKTAPIFSDEQGYPNLRPFGVH
jgi:hypothetical protein